MKRTLGLLTVLGLIALPTGCGEDGGCLTPGEVEREVNKIALGIESSSGDVEVKQQEIREVRGRACE